MWRRLKIQLENYCNDSTLHGIQYVSKPNRPILEKLLWLTAIICSGIYAIIIINSSWLKFQRNPTITGIDVNFHNKTVLFPSTFIFPSDPIDYKLFETVLASELHIDTKLSANRELYKFFQLLPTLNFDHLKNLSIPFGFEYRSNKSLTQLVLSYVYSCEMFFMSCSIKGRSINCCQQFHPILTEQGFGFVFNNHRKSTKLTYIFESDTSWNLEILTHNITIPSTIYFTDISAWIYYEIMPQFTWEHGFTSTLLLDVEEYYNDENIRELSLKQRQCIFADQLNYMPDGNSQLYDYSECVIECRKLMQYKLCKCILYFYTMNRQNFKVCSLRQMQCIKINQNQILTAQCECLKNCHSSEYKIYKTVDVAKIKKLTRISDSNVYEEEVDPDFNKIPLTIGFYSWPLVRYKREVLFGWIDLLVSFGGIAGLFLGFSLLSAIEFIYYFTMRFFFAYSRHRKPFIVQNRTNQIFRLAVESPLPQHPYAFVH